MLRRDEEFRQAREHGSYVNPLRAKSDEAMMLAGYGGGLDGPFTQGRTIFQTWTVVNPS